jgi:hypothetical protein
MKPKSDPRRVPAELAFMSSVRTAAPAPDCKAATATRCEYVDVEGQCARLTLQTLCRRHRK